MHHNLPAGATEEFESIQPVAGRAQAPRSSDLRPSLRAPRTNWGLRHHNADAYEAPGRIY